MSKLIERKYLFLTKISHLQLQVVKLILVFLSKNIDATLKIPDIFTILWFLLHKNDKNNKWMDVSYFPRGSKSSNSISCQTLWQFQYSKISITYQVHIHTYGIFFRMNTLLQNVMIYQLGLYFECGASKLWFFFRF